MICWESQGIKVLVRRDDGEEGVVVSIGRGGEFGFDDRSSYGDGVVFLDMQAPRGRRDDVRREVMPLICTV
jgi:hypothetical protein